MLNIPLIAAKIIRIIIKNLTLVVDSGGGYCQRRVKKSWYYQLLFTVIIHFVLNSLVLLGKIFVHKE